MFEPVRGKPDFPSLEAEIAFWWQSAGIYEKSLEARRGKRRFVFFEGPPTANGMPHPGHCLTRTIKDFYPRYRTMRGEFCERKAGWDTHGLPVEVEVCKELGIHSKAEIEAYGVERFIHRCQESVWRYTKEWETLTRRIGFWIDLSKAYVTYHESFVESVWWALATLFERGLLYKGHKIVWWWAQGGTALSSGEVGQGYREVADPSVYVAFPLLDAAGQATRQHLVAWTTTPWTLPSNQFAAVKADLEYVALREAGAADGAAEYIVAEPLAASLGEKLKKQFDVVERMPGAAVVGRSYLPPFDTYRSPGPPKPAPLVGGGAEPASWRVIAADFVTTDSGTGVVHIAPAFGEVDYGVLVAEQARFVTGAGPTLLNAVAADGTFTDAFPMGSGRFVKDCDRDITRDIKNRGLLVHQEQYVHDYPFCWRAEKDPLIQYPRESWFIRTSRYRDAMLANNEQITWLPDHIKHGRFGNFLETNVDWALSRERYWGTPLPIWVCEHTGKAEAMPSYAALLAKPGVAGTEVFDEAKQAKPDLSDDLRVHKPYIDAVTYDSPFAAGARMRRVPEVIDCWFDSGCMPFAQWGWPHRGHDDFAAQFPADFISEAIDQTRGWFYSQLAISTLLFGAGADAGPTGAVPTPPSTYPHPFKTCIVLGHMLGEDGQKMSKSRRNYREPAEIFDAYGADALRWFFLAGQPPWTSIRYSERAIRESVPEFLLRLWNVYSFFVIYARIDGFDPSAVLDAPGQLDHADLARARGWRPVSNRCELDRWMLSELYATAATMVERLDAYDHFAAAGAVSRLVDAMSNWFVRRSRDRFWASGRADTGPDANPEKHDAYWTLYETLLVVARLVAPFVPFTAEAMWRNLAVAVFGHERVPESVHLTDFPRGEVSLVDGDLVRRMALVRDVASLGRAARATEKLKVRQPLSKVEVILADATPGDDDWLAAHADLVCDELNVKQFEICREPDRYIERSVLPDLKRLGPRLGKNLPKVRQALGAADASAILASLQQSGTATLPLPGGGEVKLEDGDVIVRTTARPGWAAAEGPRAVVVVSSALTPELVAEGLVREAVHAVQTIRKDLDLEFTDQIDLAFASPSAVLRTAIEEHREFVSAQTLAASVLVVVDGLPGEPIDLDGHLLTIVVKPVVPKKATHG
jgi:isoleucyl-tRNA synthetase